MADDQEYVTVREAARRSGYTADYVRDLLRDGKIQGRKLAGLVWEVDLEDLLRYKREQDRIREEGR